MAESRPVFTNTMVPPSGVIVDPNDARTWWMASAKREFDRSPIRAQMHDHCMHLAGIPGAKFYNEARPYVAVTSAVAAYYGLDTPSTIADVYNYEAEAMGQKMIYGEDSMPTIDFREPLIAEKSDLAKLKAPNWLDFPRVRFSLDIQKLYAEMGSVSGSFCGAFSLAVAIRTYPKLIRDIKKEPAFAHELFSVLVDEILPSYLKTLKEYTGHTQANGADAWAAFPNLTPELMEEWVIPYAQRLSDNCQKFGMSAVTTGGGDYCEERLERFDKEILKKCLDVRRRTQGGTPAVFLGMGRWHEYPLEPVSEYLERYRQQGIRANVSAGVNARLLRDGPVADVVDNVKRFVNAFGRDHNLSIHLANIPADTPPEHVHAAVQATHAYSKWPIADNLDAVEFRLQQRESFQEYVAKMSNGAGIVAGCDGGVNG